MIPLLGSPRWLMAASAGFAVMIAGAGGYLTGFGRHPAPPAPPARIVTVTPSPATTIVKPVIRHTQTRVIIRGYPVRVAVPGPVVRVPVPAPVITQPPCVRRCFGRHHHRRGYP